MLGVTTMPVLYGAVFVMATETVLMGQMKVLLHVQCQAHVRIIKNNLDVEIPNALTGTYL